MTNPPNTAVPGVWHTHPLPQSVLWGQTVYTTLVWPLPSVALQHHWARLQAGAVWLGANTLPFTLASLTQQLTERCPSAPHTHYRVRVTLWLAPTGQTTVQTMPVIQGHVTAQPLPLAAWPAEPTPCNAITLPGQRPHPTVKHGLMRDAMATQLTHAPDCCLWVNPQGLLTEGPTVALAAWWQDHWCFAHPVLHGCLPSITVQGLQQWLQANNIPWVWQALTPTQAGQSPLAVLSAVQGVRPVQQFNAKPLPPWPHALPPDPWQASWQPSL
jgi:branched-subunit amino acid aminotransferase/4-amino-4-deoxychorismate lyase